MVFVCVSCVLLWSFVLLDMDHWSDANKYDDDDDCKRIYGTGSVKILKKSPQNIRRYTDIFYSVQ